MTKTNPKVDWFFKKPTPWQKEVAKLRAIVVDCPLKEELKWGCPCYTSENKNIILVHTFKEYCALLFFKGVLLKDPKRILIQQTKNVQAGRQVRFTNLQEINALEPALKSYIEDAIAVEKSGLKVKLKTISEFKIPAEFKNQLDDNPTLKTAFKALTPGRQRGYLFYFSSAKQSTTRETRVAKCTPKILDGKGLDDE